MKKSLRSYILTKERIYLTYKGAAHEIPSSAAEKFTALSLALAHQGSDAQLDAILGIAHSEISHLPPTSWSKLNPSVYCYNGRIVPESLSAYIEFLKALNFPLADIDAFMTQLDQNPSFRIRNQLFGALLASGFTLTPAGEIVGFVKAARTLGDPSIARKFLCPRSNVNDDPEGTTASDHLVHARPAAGDTQHLYLPCLVSPRNVVTLVGQAPNTQLAVCAYVIPGDSATDMAIADAPASGFSVYVMPSTHAWGASDAELFKPLADTRYASETDALVAAVPFASGLPANTTLVIRAPTGQDLHRLSSGSATS